MVDLQRLGEVRPVEELLGKQVVDDHPGAALVDRPRDHRPNAIDAAEKCQVGRSERSAGKTVRPVGKPRHFAQQRLGPRRGRAGIVKDRKTAVGFDVHVVGLELEVGAEAVRVQHPDVVEVHQVLVYELPVAREVDFDLVAQAAFLPPEERELLVDPGHRVSQRPGIVIEVDEDVAPPDVEPQWCQGAIGDVEALGLGHVGGPLQLAVEAVYPAVVRAAERLEIARSVCNLDTSVDTHVVAGVQLTVSIAREQYGLANQAQRHVVAGIGQLLDPSHVEPFAFEVLGHLATEDLRAGIDRARRMGRLVQRDPGPCRIYLGRIGHHVPPFPTVPHCEIHAAIRNVAGHQLPPWRTSLPPSGPCGLSAVALRSECKSLARLLRRPEEVRPSSNRYWVGEESSVARAPAGTVQAIVRPG